MAGSENRPSSNGGGDSNQKIKDGSEQPNERETEEKLDRRNEIQLMFKDAPSTIAELRNREEAELRFAGVTVLVLIASYILLFLQYWTILGIVITIYVVYTIPLIKEHKDDYLSDKVEDLMTKKSDDEIIEQERD